MNRLNALVPIIEAHAQELKKPGVLSVRPGYRVENGWLTQEPAIVVITARDAGEIPLPAEISGVRVDVRQATSVEELRYQQPDRYAKLEAQRPELRADAFPELDPLVDATSVATAPPVVVEAAKPQIPYTGPDGVSLTPVSGNIPLTCHASPDAGWPTLRAFLSKTQSNLTVGLYDFTSKHILDEVERDLRVGKTLEITLDSPALNPTADQSDSDTLQSLSHELGDSLKAAWALVRANKAIPRWIYPTAYHIKVAVRDNESVWLSSGNWNNSNQPDMDPFNAPKADDQQTASKSDRDWHIIINHPGLAQTLAAYLKHDYDVASSQQNAVPAPLAAEPGVAVPASFELEARARWRFFRPTTIENEPVTITPLLTPDPGVYQPAMLRLLSGAQRKLYIQLQYIHPSNSAADADFNELIDLVAQKIQGRVDVRIILSQYQTSNGWLERLQDAGVDASVVKIQNGVHNKGFVVDSKTVALGSQNWSGDGVLRNRDASVIIENERAARYYEMLFVHDWDNIARQSMGQ
jgi:phosphatidylserine/phosphatidylglycerophosphate/cardiolipin synthase-like enzyme